jgi:hypothetical protein
MRNKSREYEHWKVKMITKEQRNQYLWRSRKTWRCKHFVAKCFSAKKQAEVWRKARKRWNFLQRELSIYRGEGGGQFQEPASIRLLRGFRMTRVHSDVPRVAFFWLKFKSFRGIESSESTRFPEELVLGNSGKTATLETSGLPKFIK